MIMTKRNKETHLFFLHTRYQSWAPGVERSSASLLQQGGLWSLSIPHPPHTDTKTPVGQKQWSDSSWAVSKSLTKLFFKWRHSEGRELLTHVVTSICSAVCQTYLARVPRVCLPHALLFTHSVLVFRKFNPAASHHITVHHKPVNKGEAH